MELILLTYRLFYWVCLAPIWWISNQLAAVFYPFEGDSGYLILSWVFSMLIGIGVIAACMTWL
jgi:hypothetical protein